MGGFERLVLELVLCCELFKKKKFCVLGECVGLRPSMQAAVVKFSVARPP